MKRTALTLLLSSLPLPCLAADIPAGWINGNNSTAYTTPRGTLEINGSALRVNDSIDFLDIREDLLAGNRRLVGDSGDLSGHRFELHYGITDWLSVYFKQQQHELRVDVGEISSVNVLEIDKDLETESRELGLKWVFYESDLLASNGRVTAAALEISAFQSSSASFDVVTDAISIDGLNVNFAIPRTFFVDDLEDDGWTARLLYSTKILGSGVGTAWLGYRDSESSSRTGSNIEADIVARIFRQQFNVEESYWLAGASLNYFITPRMPLLLSYEYLRTNNSNFARDPLTPPSGLPGFLSANPATENANHTLKAQIAYWLTPDLHIKLSGNLYSNQFLGVLPHYNNPLSGSFSDNPYGYLGLGVGYRMDF